MNGIFHTTPVGLAVGWGIPTLAGLVVLIITEAVKFTRIGLMRRAGRLSNKI